MLESEKFFKTQGWLPASQPYKNLLYAHIIFVVKYRKKLMIGSIADDVKQLIFEICQKHHWYIVRMESDKDHLHILLQYNPTDSITKIVTVLKSYSTFHIWKRYRSILTKRFWEKTLSGRMKILQQAWVMLPRQPLNDTSKTRDNDKPT